MNASKNERVIIGTPDKEKNMFLVWATIDNDRSLRDFCQYIVDSCPDTRDFIMIRESTGVAYDFTGICRDILKIKSKRFNNM